MSTGGPENSQQESGQVREPPTGQAPPASPVRPTDELQEAFGRLRSRIEEVSAWAEQASLPGAVPSADDRSADVSGEPGSTPQPGSTPEPESIPEPESTSQPESTEVGSTLGFVRGLSRSGGIAGAVFRGGRDTVDLGAQDGTGHVPVPGLVALLDLVPRDTILEVRTSGADLRAARIGDEAFAFELVSGNEAEVDEWLSSLLPAGET